MGFGNLATAFDLDPKTIDALNAKYGQPGGAIGPPNDAPLGPPPPNDDGAPSAAEMAHYGAQPAEVAAAQRFNAPGDMPAQSATNPVNADPAWDPKKEQAATAQIARDKALAGADPQAPKAEGGEETIITTPGRYVPGGWRDTNRSATTQEGIDPSKLTEGQRQRAVADNYGQWANDDIKKANEREAIADVAYAAAHKDASDAYRAQAQRIENEKQAYTIREHEKLDALNVAAQAQVDPEAAKGSAGAQLFAALAVALGQFGASINGGPNTALQIVNGNIDRRIAAQQANINNAHKSLANEQSLYKDNLAAFGDKERAALATKMQMLDQAKAVLDEQFAGAKSNRNEAQYHAMAQGLADKRAEVADQFGIRTADHRTTTGQQHMVAGQMVGGSAQVGEKGKEDLFVPSLGVYARTKEEAVKMRDTSARTQNTVRELKQAQALIEEAKTTYDPRKLAVLQRKLDGVTARAAVTATVKEGQGAMSNGDRSVSEAGLALKDIDLGLIAKTQPWKPSLDSHQDMLNGAITAHQQEYGRMGAGAQRGREVYVKDPVTGKVESRRVLSGSNAADRNKVDNLDDLVQKPVGKSSREK